MKFLMQCIITENTLIKLAHYDETKKKGSWLTDSGS